MFGRSNTFTNSNEKCGNGTLQVPDSFPVHKEYETAAHLDTIKANQKNFQILFKSKTRPMRSYRGWNFIVQMLLVRKLLVSF